MKIEGIITSKRTKEPIPQTYIIMSVGTTEIAGFYSDGEGHYEYNPSEEYKNQILGCKFKKNGYKSTIIEQELKEESITRNIELEEDLVQVKGVTQNKKDTLPIDQVTIFFQIEHEPFPSLISDDKGKFSISLPSRYKDQELTYTAEKQGWLPAQGSVVIREESSFDIEMEEEWIEIKGITKNKKDTLPIGQVTISFQVRSESFPTVISGSEGKFNIFLPSKYKDQELKYTAKKQGWQPAQGSFPIRENTPFDIELEEKLLQIRGITKNKKDNFLIGQVAISFQVGLESFPPVISDNEGKFTISLPSRYKDLELKYSAEKQGWRPAQGSIPIRGETPFDIEMEEEWIQIRKELDRDKIKLNISVKDEQGNPLEGVLIILDSEGKQIGDALTDKNGVMEFILSSGFENKTLKYRGRLEGFKEATDKIQLKKEAYHEITLKKIIDFWLGVKEKRWFYSIGSISLFLFIIIIIKLSLPIYKKNYDLIPFVVIILYILASCSLSKGFLFPIVNIFLGLFILILCFGLPNQGLREETIKYLALYFFICLLLGFISTFIARKLTKLKKFRNSSN